MNLGEHRPTLSYPSSMPVPLLSLVMPCYNECDQIEHIIEEWTHCMREHQISFEWVVINDGSLDGTGRVLDRLRKEHRYIRVVHQLNGGHGKAVRRGYELARGTWILQIDSSGCFEPSDFPLLWEKREEATLLVAQRTHRLDSFFHRALIKLLTKFIRSTYKVDILDPDVSFRLFKREALLPLLRTVPKATDSINLAMTVVLKKESPSKVQDIRIPYRLRPNLRGRVRLRQHITDFLHVMSELTKIKVSLKLQPMH